MFIRIHFLVFCFLFTSFLSYAEKDGFPRLPKDKMDIEREWEQKKSNNNFGILDQGTLARVFSTSTPRIKIPGFISTVKVRTYGTVVGDISGRKKTYRENSNVYIEWEGARPNVGEVFALYTPRFILQSKLDFTEFEVAYKKVFSNESIKFNHAGYFYEVNAEIEVVDTSREIIRARVKNLFSSIRLGDKLIKPLPIHTRIPRKPYSNRVTASVVMGHPYNRISAIEGSFFYINRGKKDGVDVGTVFNTLEKVSLYRRAPIKKKVELGEAVVVFATGSYSTAFVTKQWDSIRLGSLLETSHSTDEVEANMIRKMKRRSALDIIEKELDVEGLSSEDRARLEALHQQEVRKKSEDSSEPDALITGPEEEEEKSLATKYFDEGPKKKKKKKKKKNRQEISDEEGLNSLF